LRYLREMTCQEVADELSISRITVHRHLRESLERIRVYFKSIQ
jgi:DNA-directed RNA polymerase specialized sigma subunit